MSSTKTILCVFVLFAIFTKAISDEPPGNDGSHPDFPPSSESSGDSEESDEDGPQNRLFFPTITRTTCNYTTEPGLSCASCNQVLLCRSNNVGILRNCTFLRRFCNNGHCSFFPGPACSPTTTTDGTTATESTSTTDGSTNTDETTTDGTTTPGG